jgi:hypothetical protein
MKRKLLGIFLFVLLVTTCIPIINAVGEKCQKKENYVSNEKIKNGYIEISGVITNKDFTSIIGSNFWKIMFLRPKGNDDPAAFIFYWFIRLKEQATISLYDEQGGDLIWEHDGIGIQQIRMLTFSGNYIPSLTMDGDLKINVEGNFRQIQIKEK